MRSSSGKAETREDKKMKTRNRFMVEPFTVFASKTTPEMMTDLLKDRCVEQFPFLAVAAVHGP